MKKLFAALLCVVLVLSSVVQVAALQKYERYFDTVVDDDFRVGDANDDGRVNAIDTLEMKKYYAFMSEINEDGADINSDGTVNAKDLLILKKCQAGVDSLENYKDDSVVDNFSIAGVDISEFSIVYHADAKYIENNYYAADAMRRFIRTATDINLPVVEAADATTEHKIEFVDVTTVPGMEEKLYIENYFYEVKGGDLLIYGTRRGALYSVFEIAEDYLGFRFYSDDFVFMNEVRVADIPEGTESYREPALEFRYTRQSFGHEAADYHFFARRLNGSQINGNQEEYRGTLTGPQIANAHSYDYYWKMATGRVDVYYDGTNGGEYGAKYNAGITQDDTSWNPCFTSNDDYGTLFRGLLEGIRYHTSWKTFWKDTTSVSFSICDNRTVCTCSGCKYIMSSGNDRKLGKRLECGEAGLNLYLANRACRDIQVYYEGRPASTFDNGEKTEKSENGYGEPITDVHPGLQLYTILYDHTFPHELLLTDEKYKDVAPHENLIIMFCGNPCNNHYMGSGECGDNVNILDMNGQVDAEAFAAWGDVTKVTGSQMWFWYYPVNYNTYLTDSPNIINIWYDFKYVVEECNVTGIFYEGGGAGYLFEKLKAHLGTMMMWSFEKDENGNVVYMSFEEFCEVMKEYLYIFYGEGYEYIYDYIWMHDKAGNESGICYVNNCDYPGDMFDYEYSRDNYEEMRGLLTKALALAEGDQIRRIERLIVSCDALGLSACHRSWYLEGTEETKALYKERYTWMYNYIKNNHLNVGLGADVQNIALDFEKAPFVLYYTGGTWRPELNEEWTWTGSTPGWGYA
ncbi:MAG: DUF4838 domain-containing protein [Clostridia bacterium]|nr:DUF4838 domain-containing protein [Clostridia bacterium]